MRAARAGVAAMAAAVALVGVAATQRSGTVSPAPCRPEDVSVESGGPTAPFGEPGLLLRLFNVSDETCRLLGHPGVQVVGADGAWADVAVTVRDATVTNGRPWTGDLPPDLVAVTTVNARPDPDARRQAALRLVLPEGGAVEVDGGDLSIGGAGVDVTAFEADSQDR